MTGEMSREEVTREAYPIHFALADELKGTVEPFDQYQGPYVHALQTRFWVIVEENGAECRLYDERNDKQSPRFLWGDSGRAVELVRARRRWRRIKRD